MDMKQVWRYAFLALMATAVVAAAAVAQEVSFKDPVGDDNGPGAYTYPTDSVYRPGSFDLTSFKMKVSGGKATIEVGQNSNLEDKCWTMQFGFCVQEVFIFIKTDPNTGHTEGLPGLNVQFAPEAGWNKVIILSPQPPSRVRQEVELKVAKALQPDVIVPNRVSGAGRIISTKLDLKDIGAGDVTKWGYQVLMQSNEGFPAPTDLLTRKVNEYEGQHRFGGGTDGDCDPHVMDVLAGNGVGDKSEIDAQHAMLAYECNADGTSKKMATLTMIYVK
jgi:carbohydrate-binding DOMON domain-containing protein